MSVATSAATDTPAMTQNAHCAPLVNASANEDPAAELVVEVADRDRRCDGDADGAADLLRGADQARRETRLALLHAGERGDRDRDPRERHAEADQQVAGQEVVANDPSAGICEYQSIPAVIATNPAAITGFGPILRREELREARPEHGASRPWPRRRRPVCSAE